MRPSTLRPLSPIGEGRLHAAAKQLGAGYVLVSTDQGASFESWGLGAESVWIVS